MNSTSNVNLFSNIERRHGRATIELVKGLKKQGVKVAKLEAKFTFLLECKRKKVFPKTLQVQPPKCMHPADVKRLTFNLSKIVLSYATSRCRSEKRWAKKALEKSHSSVKTVLDIDEYSALCDVIEQNVKTTRAKQNLHKQRKLAMLLKNSADVELKSRGYNYKNDTNRLVNLSDYNPSDKQNALLSRNMKHGIAPEKIPVMAIVHAVESTSTHLPIAETTQWKCNISHLLKTNCKVKKNLTTEELTELKNLKIVIKEKDLVFLTADKGGSTVIMNRNNYVEKLKDVVQADLYEKIDTNVVTDFPKDVSMKLRKWSAQKIRNEKAIVKLLKDEKRSADVIANAEEREKALRKEINSFNHGAEELHKTPHMYGKPKTHKPNIPMRPIVNTIDSIFRDAEKFLKPILAVAASNSKFNLRNSFAALEELKNTQIDEHTRICSFDVTNMFNSIPRDELLMVLCNKLETHKIQLAKITKLSPTQIVELVDLILNNIFFELENDIYTQKSGLAMGSKISPPLSDIYMEHFLEKALAGTRFNPLLFKKYVDDCICIFNCKEMNETQLLEHLNSQNTHIKFTLEKETNSSLPYLDILISRETQKLNFTVYRKPTDLGILLSFDSNHSFATKATVARAGLQRAYEYCENKEEREIELSKVYQTLYKNNYPRKFIDKVHEKVKMFITQKEEKAKAAENAAASDTENVPPVVTSNNVSKAGFKNVLKIPYVQGLSEKINKLTQKAFDGKVRVVYSCENTLRKTLMHVKPEKKTLLKNCVYKIRCECEAEYIGQTRRSLATRLGEHKDEMNKIQNECNKNHNRVALHAQKTNHKFDFENVSVLHFESNWNKRIVAESMAMIAKQSVISQSSRSIDKIFWKAIIDDEKKAKGKPYFYEKASVSGTSQHVQQNALGGDHTAAEAAAERQARLAAVSYYLRPRTHGVATT
jgi:Reverse transcriptase (RNA-dependent DNA polymerase)